MVLYLFLIAPLFPRDWLTGRGRTSGRETSDMRGEEPPTDRNGETERSEERGEEWGSGSRLESGVTAVVTTVCLNFIY